MATGGVNNLTGQSIGAKGFSWSDLYRKVPSDLIISTADKIPLPIESWYWSAMNICVYLIMAWYTDSILSDEYGKQLPFHFFIHPSYWGWNFSSYTQKNNLENWIKSTNKKQKQHLNQYPNFNLNTQKSIFYSDVQTLGKEASDPLIPAFLRVLHLYKKFGNINAVEDTSFSVKKGELLAIVGANGSGKSTLCYMLCGITPASSGNALLADKFSLIQDYFKSTSLYVGWCPQHDLLFDELTPLEHIFLICTISWVI